DKTQGQYDPTVGPLVDLWGFGAKKHRQIPSDKDISKAKELVGYQYIIAHESESMIRKSKLGIQLDLSSIAKGWGVDQVGRLLEQQGIAHYMVEIGGEVRTMGGKPDGSTWQIGVLA